MGARPCACNWYTPGLVSRTPSASAMAAMGQPLLGDGVWRASRARVRSGTPPPANASSSAVMRAGSHESTSSARAAHLPAYSQ